MLFDDDKQVKFQHEAEGTWGEFSTSAGSVHYLLTKARLGKASTDPERRLTSLLRPVREILDPSTLNFNQLLQRDLDDHRVANGLIPYILTPEPTGPAFFPPIVAVLLPFDGARPLACFPAKSETTDTGNPRFQMETYGDSIRVRRHINGDGSWHSIKLGRVSWNEEAAKLVVIDGQHRAMALIAIDRTLRAGSWNEGGGAKYRHFYETKIRELLANRKVELEKIEIPVTLCWFPETGIDTQKAARKLFIDVNKEARPPSEARIILLSDSELINILTRSLLNSMRDRNSKIPLYAVEYDNPDPDSELPVRWSVLTNLNLLKYVVQFTVFAPPTKAARMDWKFGGRANERDMDGAMRSRLRINDLFEDEVTDGDRTIQNSAISNKRFPLSRVKEIENEFLEGWGGAILEIFSGLLPYEAHANALKELEAGWIQDQDISGLAYEALFNGVGMYWTLRASAEHHAKLAQQARGPKKSTKVQKPDIVAVWDFLDQMKDPTGVPRPRAKFLGLRANHYLGKSTDSSLKDAADAFLVLNTHACQLGLVMAFTALADANDRNKSHAVHELAKHLIGAWNAALNTKSLEGRDRRLVFNRAELSEGDGQSSSRKYYVNRIRRMDTPMSVYFRYFWLELLGLPAAREKWAGVLDEKKFDEFLSNARKAYLDYLESEQLKAMQQSHPNKPSAWHHLQSQKLERAALGRALRYWFDISEPDFEKWLRLQTSVPAVTPSAPEADADVEANSVHGGSLGEPSNADHIEEDE